MDPELVAFLNQLGGSGSLFSFDDETSIFEAVATIKENAEQIAETLPEELEEQPNETAAAISEELMFHDYWKYALIFGALEPDVYQIYFPINENISARLPLSAEDSIAVADIFKDEIDNLSLSEDSSAADVASAINIALGCFYMGIEMAIGYPDEDGDWQKAAQIS